MARITIRVTTDTMEDLRDCIEGILQEIEDGETMQGCSDFEFNVEGDLGGITSHEDEAD